jgi:hypothetical protein
VQPFALHRELVERDAVLNFLHRRGSVTPGELRADLDLNVFELSSHLRELDRAGLVAEVGFTPTDALHVTGELDFGSTATSAQAAEYLRGDAGVDELCEGVIAATQREIEDTILEHVVRRELGTFGSQRQPSVFTSLDLGVSGQLPGAGDDDGLEHQSTWSPDR